MKNVLIVAIGDVGNEPEAIRQILERFNYFVGVKYVGRPDDFIEVLLNELPFEADCIIISCHGDNGMIKMPLLAEEVYGADEPRGDFSADLVGQYLKLKNKLIINLGCTTGYKEMSEAFSKDNTYIAPYDYIDGNAAVFFVIHLFYEMCQNGRMLEEAYTLASGTDNETALFTLVVES